MKRRQAETTQDNQTKSRLEWEGLKDIKKISYKIEIFFFQKVGKLMFIHLKKKILFKLLF